LSKILITGGAGFIGSQLGKALADRGDDVLLVDNLRYGHLDNLVIDGATFGRFTCVDIRDPRYSALCEGVDTVVHLAGISALPVCQEDPNEAYSCNVGGVGAVLEAARRADVKRVIFASTSATYEKTKADKLSEDMPIQPDLTYAMTKAAAEQLCEGFAKNYGMDIITCRFFNVYGPHQDILRTSPPFTSYVARELVMNRRPKLFNQSEAQRDYVHSSDLIRLLLMMIDSDGHFAGERFNICTGQGYSVPDLYRIFAEISGKQIEPEWGDPATFWDKYPALYASDHALDRARIAEEVYKHAVGDPTKTQSRFNWTAQMDIRDGLATVYADAERRFAAAG
jgi:UDP-glucose 4-epimerase